MGAYLPYRLPVFNQSLGSRFILLLSGMVTTQAPWSDGNKMMPAGSSWPSTVAITKTLRIYPESYSCIAGKPGRLVHSCSSLRADVPLTSSAGASPPDGSVQEMNGRSYLFAYQRWFDGSADRSSACHPRLVSSTCCRGCCL